MRTSANICCTVRTSANVCCMYCAVVRDETSTQSLNRSLAGSARNLLTDQQPQHTSDSDLARRPRSSNDVIDASAI